MREITLIQSEIYSVDKYPQHTGFYLVTSETEQVIVFRSKSFINFIVSNNDEPLKELWDTLIRLSTNDTPNNLELNSDVVTTAFILEFTKLIKN